MSIYPLIRTGLFWLKPEWAHHLFLWVLAGLYRLGLLRYWRKTQPGKPVHVMGIDFPNPIGLSAGFDKNGDYIDALGQLGFGFIEVGTTTPKPQPGNARPRLFRLPQAQAIINRMGFNNKGVDHLVTQLKKMRFKGVLGINIGKNKATPIENSIDDYLYCLHRVYPYASYIAINISSPNTPHLRDLQSDVYLEHLLTALKAAQKQATQQHGRYVPIAVKIAPDLTEEATRSIAHLLRHHGIDGVIATNTTIKRPTDIQHLPHANEAGGLSGKPLFDPATQVLTWLHETLQGQIPIIGVGGILNQHDAQKKFDAGASLIQVYTGLIYHGPNLLNN